MYEKILVALDNSPAGDTLIDHITKLALVHGSRLLLVHVADGWAARHYNHLDLADSEEMKTDRDYLEGVRAKLEQSGLKASTHLALGNPPDEILKTAEKEHCDLIAMSSHGHRFLADLFLGSTIDTVRHKAHVPVLVVRAAT